MLPRLVRRGTAFGKFENATWSVFANMLVGFLVSLVQ
jgi:hypothetical protein